MMSIGTERLAAGTRVGNYRVDAMLYGCTTGMVYSASHALLPRRAHLKIVHSSAGGMRPLAVQMLREACLLEALRHPSVPTVFESGVHADGRAWFAFEAVAGTRVSEQLASAMELRAAVDLIRDIAQVLAHAHRRGVIHGSLRPDKIVRTEGRACPVCIVDWGDARAYDSAVALPRVPAPGARAYLAPEQSLRDAIDDRADIYSLGVIAYQALTGALPTPDIHVPMRERCSRAPRELAALVERMLSRTPERRPSGVEVVATLEPVLAHLATLELEIEIVEPIESHAGMPRIRRPRWTPAHLLTSDLGDSISGEILVPEKLRRSS